MRRPPGCCRRCRSAHSPPDRAVGLVICNDSGVSHVAAAASARQLTLFGVTRPGRTGPWSPRAVCVGAEDAWPPEDEVEQQARRLLDGQQ